VSIISSRHSKTRIQTQCIYTKLSLCPPPAPTGIPEYKVWYSLISRCHNQHDKDWRNYGGRGIAVCERWRVSFDLFLRDMGLRPTDSHQINRINNDGNYEPSNCEWTDRQKQNRNKRTNRIILFNNKNLCLKEWEEITGIPSRIIRYRLDKLRWSVEKTLTTPPKQITINH
jgi:hypothetical protein